MSSFSLSTLFHKQSKRCPPGVICIENMTFFFLFLTILLISYILYFHFFSSSSSVHVTNSPKIYIQEKETNTNVSSSGWSGWLGSGFGLFPKPNYSYSNLPGDVLMNPYVPPVRDERYWMFPTSGLGPAGIPPLGIPPGRIPINVPTAIGAIDTNYRQIGMLTPVNPVPNGKPQMIPLMGRPLFSNRDKWQYYSMSDQKNSIKLPIIYKGKNATNEYGVDKVSNGDNVRVEGYNETFKVTEYENSPMQYLPFL